MANRKLEIYYHCDKEYPGTATKYNSITTMNDFLYPNKEPVMVVLNEVNLDTKRKVSHMYITGKEEEAKKILSKENKYEVKDPIGFIERCKTGKMVIYISPLGKKYFFPKSPATKVFSNALELKEELASFIENFLSKPIEDKEKLEISKK